MILPLHFPEPIPGRFVRFGYERRIVRVQPHVLATSLPCVEVVYSAEDARVLARRSSFDPDAVAELMRRYTPVISRQGPDAYSLIAQKIRRNAHRYKPRGTVRFSSWFHRLITNAGIDAHRKYGTRPSFQIEDYDRPQESSDIGLVELHEALATLSETSRLVAHAVLHGESFAEACSHFQADPQVVRIEIARLTGREALI